mmetsp:Transcript_24694/g.73689  ORF Transcript_24694/g.73689 Transcript_24694/m.73689 type:complete len:434 (+) Transcript_24694:869-2170(+)
MMSSSRQSTSTTSFFDGLLDVAGWALRSFSSRNPMRSSCSASFSTTSSCRLRRSCASSPRSWSEVFKSRCSRITALPLRAASPAAISLTSLSADASRCSCASVAVVGSRDPNIRASPPVRCSPRGMAAAAPPRPTPLSGTSDRSAISCSSAAPSMSLELASAEASSASRITDSWPLWRGTHRPLRLPRPMPRTLPPRELAAAPLCRGAEGAGGSPAMAGVTATRWEGSRSISFRRVSANSSDVLRAASRELARSCRSVLSLPANEAALALVVVPPSFTASRAASALAMVFSRSATCAWWSPLIIAMNSRKSLRCLLLASSFKAVSVRSSLRLAVSVRRFSCSARKAVACRPCLRASVSRSASCCDFRCATACACLASRPATASRASSMPFLEVRSAVSNAVNCANNCCRSATSRTLRAWRAALLFMSTSSWAC